MTTAGVPESLVRARSAAADQLAAAADLTRTKDAGTPVVLIRGAERLWTAEDGPGAAASLQRPEDQDLFR
jgi:coenzyme F420-0:L-glutamate ligase/coenzyme F420-1:gamma-L-glutamate ligase